jgi:hypothetical protein
MSREYASPDLANLIAARLSPAEFARRVRAPLTEAEASEIAELIEWFTRRYPTAKERLAYARRKLRQYQKGHAAHPSATERPTYLETARRLAAAHRAADPATLLVLLDRDPAEKEIRLLEVTPSAPTMGELLPVGFMPRPDLGVPFPSTVMLLSPDEWSAVRKGRLDLPEGWSSSRLETL